MTNPDDANPDSDAPSSYVDQLEDRVEELEDRVEALEDIFAPRLIDRQTKHVNSRKEDARKHLSDGDIEPAVVKSPLGDGRDPQTCVAKIKGIVTFIDGVDDTVEEGETIAVRVTRVQENCAYGIPADDRPTDP